MLEHAQITGMYMCMCHTAESCNTMQSTATYATQMQHIYNTHATRCNVFGTHATHCNTYTRAYAMLQTRKFGFFFEISPG